MLNIDIAPIHSHAIYLFVKGLKSIKLDFKNPADNLVDVVVSFFFHFIHLQKRFYQQQRILISQLLWKCISLIQGNPGTNSVGWERAGCWVRRLPLARRRRADLSEVPCQKPQRFWVTEHKSGIPVKALPPRTCTTDRTWWINTHTHTNTFVFGKSGDIP